MATTHRPAQPVVEWPTLCVALAIYGGFAGLTWFHAALPWWLIVPLGAVLAAWHGSLQHEVVHGHPTRSRAVNRALAVPSLLLWLPFGLYRESHLRHHVDTRITDPLDDPESFYVTPGAWARMGRARRGLLWALNTLAGRMLIGPFRAVTATWTASARRLAAGDGREARFWALHVLGLGAVAGWAVGVCGMPVWLFALSFAYGGTALTLLRSFLEHQAAEAVPERTAVVEAGPLMSLLFLNNNLHAVHHAKPAVPWYKLPELYWRERHAWLTENGGYRYPSYARIAARYLFTAKEPPVHPLPGGRVPAPRGGHDRAAAPSPATPRPDQTNAAGSPEAASSSMRA